MLNVRPNKSAFDFAYSAGGDTVPAGEPGHVSVRFFSQLGFYFRHFDHGQFVSAVVFTFGLIVSAFLVSVPGIVKVSAKPQVSRIHAGGVITARAIVQDALAIGNRPKMDYPGQSVSTHGRVVAANIHSAITIFVGTSSPQPAGISDFNFGVKTPEDTRCQNQFFMPVGHNVPARLLTGRFGPVLQRTESEGN